MTTSLRSRISFSANERTARFRGKWAGEVRRLVIMLPWRRSVWGKLNRLLTQCYKCYIIRHISFVMLSNTVNILTLTFKAESFERSPV